MDLRFEGRRVLVVGASAGIGRATARMLAEEGARVAMAARGAEALDAAHAELSAQHGANRVWRMAGDMTRTADIDRIVAACESGFGPIFGAVANVGLSPSPLGFDVDDDVWEAGLDQNLNSAFRFARATLSRMAARREGALVFISSIAGIGALGSPVVYAATKAAVNHMSTALARFAGETGVRVNAVAPGNIIFPGGSWEANATGPRAEAWARWIRREVPLNRYGTPQEIGDVVTFLIGARASFINGAVIVVDGGQTR
jgi:3-oxoacyl-[acyl-carrier protein] reductase